MMANNWFDFFFLLFNKLRFCLYVTLISLESELETYGKINPKKQYKPILWEEITVLVNTEKEKGVWDL